MCPVVSSTGGPTRSKRTDPTSHPWGTLRPRLQGSIPLVVIVLGQRGHRDTEEVTVGGWNETDTIHRKGGKVLKKMNMKDEWVSNPKEDWRKRCKKLVCWTLGWTKGRTWVRRSPPRLVQVGGGRDNPFQEHIGTSQWSKVSRPWSLHSRTSCLVPIGVFNYFFNRPRCIGTCHRETFFSVLHTDRTQFLVFDQGKFSLEYWVKPYVFSKEKGVHLIVLKSTTGKEIKSNDKGKYKRRVLSFPWPPTPRPLRCF